METTIVIKETIEASHKLKDTEDLITKKCCNDHGHSYKIKVVLSGYKNEKSGLLVDFAIIKNIIRKYDHQNLNSLMSNNSTAENFAEVLYDDIKKYFNDKKIYMIDVLVQVKETEKTSVVVGYDLLVRFLSIE